jgi:hypothetical protein
MDPITAQKPGDVLLDRYFPKADPDTREQAREAFRAYAGHLVRIGERILHQEKQAADSTKSDRRPTIQPTPAESLQA